ncbi:glutaminase [Streptomyces sp. NPDC059781]|uniref:glutaminase n=1 Tax=Streptomyces sp. NPDC059781 TaxID=3346943 RepID=UPI0036483AE5
MRPIIKDYPAEALADVKSDTSGEPAGHIPGLVAAHPGHLGAAFAMLDGKTYGAGDIDIEFTIQSISKPFVYALACLITDSTPYSPKSVSSPPGNHSTGYQLLAQGYRVITERFRSGHRSGDEVVSRDAQGSCAVERGVRRLDSSAQGPRWFPFLPHSTCLTPWSSG